LILMLPLPSAFTFLMKRSKFREGKRRDCAQGDRLRGRRRCAQEDDEAGKAIQAQWITLLLRRRRPARPVGGHC
jgi:hypothetical protein